LFTKAILANSLEELLKWYNNCQNNNYLQEVYNSCYLL
jgi:hypothetical protein